MYSVTAMIDQLNWQKLDYFTKIIEHQIHILTDDIPPPAPTQNYHHMKNLLVPYVRTDVCKYSFFPPHSFSMELQETIKDTQLLDIFKSGI